MLIALDYLDTYSADPVFWDAFIALAHQRGHEVIGTSVRRAQPGAAVSMPVPVVYSGADYLALAVDAQQGRLPHVWLTAHPGCVAPCACDAPAYARWRWAPAPAAAGELPKVLQSLL